MTKNAGKEDRVASTGSALRDGGSTGGPTTAAPRFSVEPRGTVLLQLLLVILKMANSILGPDLVQYIDLTNDGDLLPETSQAVQGMAPS
jgi:hypothetical protein